MMMNIVFVRTICFTHQWMDKGIKNLHINCQEKTVIALASCKRKLLNLAKITRLKDI